MTYTFESGGLLVPYTFDAPSGAFMPHVLYPLLVGSLQVRTLIQASVLVT